MSVNSGSLEHVTTLNMPSWTEAASRQRESAGEAQAAGSVTTLHTVPTL
jgi:hypothetical protein